MQIKKILTQHRRDFTAVYQCETCSYEQTGGGYDDDYFHKNVIPNMICDQCGSKSPDNYEPRSPKYPEGIQV